jgi:hypothetical protein
LTNKEYNFLIKNGSTFFKLFEVTKFCYESTEQFIKNFEDENIRLNFALKHVKNLLELENGILFG